MNRCGRCDEPITGNGSLKKKPPAFANTLGDSPADALQTALAEPTNFENHNNKEQDNVSEHPSG